MTSVATKWMSIDVPEGYTGSVVRAEIVLDGLHGGQIRIAAVRNDAPYSITGDDAKQFAVGGDKQNPRAFDEVALSGESGFLSSPSHERHIFTVVINHTLLLLSAGGFDRPGAEAAFEAVLTRLTINPKANKAEMATPRKPSD